MGVTTRQTVTTDADGLRSTGSAPARRVASLKNENWVREALDLKRAISLALSPAERVVFDELLLHSWHIGMRAKKPSDVEPEPVRCVVNLAGLSRGTGHHANTLRVAKKTLVAKGIVSETKEGLFPIKDYLTWIDPETGGPLLSASQLAWCFDALDFGAKAHRAVKERTRGGQRKRCHSMPGSVSEGNENVDMPASDLNENVDPQVPDLNVFVEILPPTIQRQNTENQHREVESVLSVQDQGTEASDRTEDEAAIETAAVMAGKFWAPKVARGIRTNINGLPGALILKVVKFQHWKVTRESKDEPETFGYLETIAERWKAKGAQSGPWDNMLDDGTMLPRSQWANPPVKPKPLAISPLSLKTTPVASPEEIQPLTADYWASKVSDPAALIAATQRGAGR
ncbi:hypothetical protein EP7_005624 (plasmid) [Isosphaeraceae bacterium EP7]